MPGSRNGPRKRAAKHTFADNLDARKRQLEAELAAAPNWDTAMRTRLAQQIKELETAQHMDGWLRSTQLRPPT